jgi:hypothetical protein
VVIRSQWCSFLSLEGTISRVWRLVWKIIGENRERHQPMPADELREVQLWHSTAMARVGMSPRRYYTDQVPGSCIPSPRGSGFEGFSCVLARRSERTAPGSNLDRADSNVQNEVVLVYMNARLGGQQPRRSSMLGQCPACGQQTRCKL